MMARGEAELRLGVLGVVNGGSYPSFPRKPLARIRWAMEAPVKNTPDKAVLMILAIHADEQGKAWPSLATVAHCGSMARRTAIRAVNELARGGLITIDKRPRLTSKYWPKSPQDAHCRSCWLAMPSAAPFCPACGDSVSPWGDSVSPNLLLMS